MLGVQWNSPRSDVLPVHQRALHLFLHHALRVLKLPWTSVLDGRSTFNNISGGRWKFPDNRVVDEDPTNESGVDSSGR